MRSDPHIKEHQSNAMKFLWQEMMNNALGGKSSMPTDVKPWPEADKERRVSISQDDFSRGVNEIELETETEQSPSE